MSSLTSEPSGRWPRLSSEVALVAAILIVVLATAALDRNHSYLSRPGDSARDIARNTALLGMFALGASVVIISGGIDLSAGSMIAFSGTICASLMLTLGAEQMNLQRPVGAVVVACAMAGTILVGFLVGTLHAWLITAVRLPPFVATLATLVGLRSLARALCESVTTAVVGAKNSQIYINDPIFKYLRDNVWVSVAVFTVLAIFTWIVLSRTVLGRHIYALGGNEQAARLSGIRTENVKWVAYCFGAITASIAGIFYVANESVAAPVNQGRGHELNAIAAAVVGGCSLQGGIGTVPGTVLGAIFLRVVIDAVAKIIKTGADVYEGLIVGVVVVMAVTFSQLRQLVASGRQLLPGALGICAIPTLTLLTGAVCVMTLGRVGGVVAGLAALGLLVAIKVWETSRARPT
jgi:ribose/xylose/arabinose/galactoside ABC-type transport system permease subunit